MEVICREARFDMSSWECCVSRMDKDRPLPGGGFVR